MAHMLQNMLHRLIFTTEWPVFHNNILTFATNLNRPSPNSMNRVITYIVLALIVPVLASCHEKAVWRIGVSQCSSDDWRSKMNDEIYREIILHPEAEVEIRSADDSNEKQIADIRYFIDNDFDIIIAAPNEADAITPIIKEVYESGTPVILFDRNINGDTYTAWQGVDNEGIGRAAARYAHHLTPGARVLEIHGLRGSTPAVGRHAGFAATADSCGLTLVASAFGDWNYADAARAADSLLAVHSDVGLIYAHNDRMAIAAADVARRRGLDIKVIGIDAAPEIGIRAVADSVIDATFLYPTEGYRLVRTALTILRGEPFERETILPVSSAVDISNADILLLQNESLKEETAKIRALKSQVDDYWNRHSVQTALFYAVTGIVVLMLGVLFLLLRAYWQRRRHQRELLVQNRRLEEQRDAQAALNEQLREATQSKLMFFTNVSHDLRTPLTLIAEPVAQLAGAGNLDPQQRTLMKIADKNVRILRRLINQILDFRKYDNGKLALNLTEEPLADLVAGWADAFHAAARRRHIKLGIDIGLPDGFTVAIDAEKIERVFFNLMSNAFKFTPDNGRIDFTCRADGDRIVMTVADTGCGIAPDDLRDIFDRFYQAGKAHPGGSGIGLSLVKAFVGLHGGSVDVTSAPGQGSVFTVGLPLRHVAATAQQPAAPLISARDVDAELDRVEPDGLPDTVADDQTGKPRLLVVDDNDDIRTMLTQLLADEYTVITASDGREGIRLAARFVPDLIICDVMMPVVDGLECCRRIKAEISTSHIPVLMLTACSLDEQRVEGYDSGADGYVSKPFNIAVLRSRCRNLIDSRKRIRQLWGAQPAGATPDSGSPAAPADVEDEFYSRFLAVVNESMGDPDLSVDDLASRMGLGRSQLYRKIKALTNFSPVELLRDLRLRRARTMLTTTQKNISEIAYEVGFSTPAYFTRCYRETFGETPTELRDRLAQ